MSDFASQNHIQVAVSQFQGKIHGGWMMPPNAPERIRLVMQDAVNYEINDLGEKILRRRRSDSFPSINLASEDEETFNDEIKL